jgi:glycosyltransferase involved in cell wall biosynthesis
MTYRPALFVGGNASPKLKEQIAAGTHPRVEYLYLREHFDFDLFTFDDIEPLTPKGLRPLTNRLGPYWGHGFLGRSSRSGSAKIVTTGEDIGLPLALLQQLTAGRREVDIITHGSYFGSQKFRRLAPLLRANPRLRFLCLSESLCRQLIEEHGFPKARVENIGYGVDTVFFAPDPSKKVKTQQIAAAGLAKRDYKTLVAATQSLDVSVKIAADSAWFQQGVDIKSDSLPPNVEARSYGDYAGLRDLYAESAFIVVPLVQAVHACGFAVIAEAMAMGKPVITTKIIGHSDYVVEGETGFYVPPGDVTALRDRISFLRENPDVVQEMGQKARLWIESRFSLEQYSARIAAAAGATASTSNYTEEPENKCSSVV